MADRREGKRKKEENARVVQCSRMDAAVKSLPHFHTLPPKQYSSDVRTSRSQTKLIRPLPFFFFFFFFFFCWQFLFRGSREEKRWKSGNGLESERRFSVFADAPGHKITGTWQIILPRAVEEVEVLLSVCRFYGCQRRWPLWNIKPASREE